MEICDSNILHDSVHKTHTHHTYLGTQQCQGLDTHILTHLQVLVVGQHCDDIPVHAHHLPLEVHELSVTHLHHIPWGQHT